MPGLAAGKAENEVMHLVDDLAVDFEVTISQQAPAVVVACLDLRLHGDAVIRRNDLPSIGPGMRLPKPR